MDNLKMFVFPHSCYTYYIASDSLYATIFTFDNVDSNFR